MTKAPVKTPWQLWLVGGFALLFNAIGVFDFVMNLAQGPTYLASAGMTPEQIAHYQQMPAWMLVVWAVGVFGAFGASVLLLMRRKPAFPVFIVMNLLSGGQTPLESMPMPIQKLMQFVPSTHFVSFSQAILFRDASFSMVWPDLLKMLAIGLAYTIFTLSRFRKMLAAVQ